MDAGRAAAAGVLCNKLQVLGEGCGEHESYRCSCRHTVPPLVQPLNDGTEGTMRAAAALWNLVVDAESTQTAEARSSSHSAALWRLVGDKRRGAGRRVVLSLFSRAKKFEYDHAHSTVLSRPLWASNGASISLPPRGTCNIAYGTPVSGVHAALHITPHFV